MSKCLQKQTSQHAMHTLTAKARLLFSDYFTRDHKKTLVNCILRMKQSESPKVRSLASNHTKSASALMIPVTIDCLQWAVSVQSGSKLWEIRVLRFVIKFDFWNMGNLEQYAKGIVYLKRN